MTQETLVWMWCTIQGISMLCVISVMTMIVIGVDLKLAWHWLLLA